MELTQGQCEGLCEMCDIDDCPLRGRVADYDEQHKLDIAKDRLIERIIREDREI